MNQRSELTTLANITLQYLKASGTNRRLCFPHFFVEVLANKDLVSGTAFDQTTVDSIKSSPPIPLPLGGSLTKKNNVEQVIEAFKEYLDDLPKKFSWENGESKVLLLALLLDGECGERICQAMGISQDLIKWGIDEQVSTQSKGLVVSPQQVIPDQIKRYIKDLNGLAQRGITPKAYGREHEIERLIRTLGRKLRGNPVLVGPPGSGKTAIVRELGLK